MKIWTHTLVRNEERYLWFAVTSVINYVDKVLLWDTGSTDNTVEVIRELKKKYRDKIDFRQVGEVDQGKFTEIRQQMLEKTKSDWIIIVDGDEVWWDDSIKKIAEAIHSGNKLDTIANRYYNLVGDIFHYQEEKAGMYKINEHTGHLTIRATKRDIPGLHFGRPHGQQGIFDDRNRLIQDRDKKKRIFLDERLYMHFTHMIRSSNKVEDLKVMKRDLKVKYELGLSFPMDFYYPEVFFRPRPSIVSSPWNTIDFRFYMKALLETPLRKFKRRVFKGKSGY